jgi:hypothetical protein
MAALRYEVTFKGEAGPALRVAFEEFAVSTGHGVTVLRCDLSDHAALHTVINRIESLGLELIDVRLIANDQE